MEGVKIYPTEYIICKNIIHFCNHRKIKLDKEYKFKNNDIIVLPPEPIIFTGAKNDQRFQIIYIPASSDIYKKQTFAKIADVSSNIIVIMSPEKKLSTTIRNVEVIPSSSFLKNHPKIWDQKNQNLVLETPEDVDHYLHLHKIAAANNFPKISPNCIESTWSGYKQGQVITITCPTIASSGLVSLTRYVGKSIEVDDEELVEGDEEL